MCALTHARMLELLGAFDTVVMGHNLTYWVIKGTLLGAVRHYGLIPYDADVDLCIPSADWAKLRRLAPSELPSWMWLQDWTSDPRFGHHGRTWAKIRDLNSDYVEYSAHTRKQHNGLQIDVYTDHDGKWPSLCGVPTGVMQVRRQPFDNIRVNIPANAEALLVAKYGDWTTLPPVAKRKSPQGRVAFVAPEWVKRMYPHLYPRAAASPQGGPH